MKIIHTSDWHLGMPAKTDTFEDCQRHFLENLYGIIRKEQVGAVICAGDVFDSVVSSADAISIYNDAVTTICRELGIPMIVIAGNHDGAARLASCSRLLEKSGLFISGRLTRDIAPVVLDDGKVRIYPVPFFTKERAAELFPDRREKIKNQETAMLAVLDHIREEMDPTKYNILVSHSMITHAELSDSDRAAMVGLVHSVSKDVFRGFDYVALGHIHKPQTLGQNIRYSGSPLKYSFGNEEKQKKGVVLLDTDTNESRFIEMRPLWDRRTVEGTYEEITSMKEGTDDYLLIRITDRFNGPDLFSEMQNRFPHLLELRGIGMTESAGQDEMTLEELRKMNEMDVMERFFSDIFDNSPTEKQEEMFRKAVEDIREGEKQ